MPWQRRTEPFPQVANGATEAYIQNGDALVVCHRDPNAPAEPIPVAELLWLLRASRIDWRSGLPV
jgi:hypothetical protein